ncbi:MAG: alpha-amylase family glycosyl hydrolase [Anaerolineales bacterium]|nr:alpha-amylase family glycosyl hydrolase [Anaerolineales bacterium]
MSALRTEPVPATDLYALSLLDEAYHILLKHFLSGYTGVMGRAMGMLQSNPGSKYNLILNKFTEEFPPVAVFRGELTAGDYLSTNIPTLGDFGRDLRVTAIEDMLLIHTANKNPSINRCKELVDETAIRDSAYLEIMQSLLEFFDRQPGFGNTDSSQGDSLTDILVAPIKASPDSLEGQLRFIVQKWGHLLGEAFSVRILRGLDYLCEEIIRQQGALDSSNVETYAPTFTASDHAEYEGYSQDKDWMPRLILLAKNTYVWLGQLSKKYQRDITTLDQIPDEELDLLASRGFTGLWLIGLWERSRASQIIKQRMGQADAVASAYSLHSYDIANDLGGWEALNNLRSRAWVRGIRLSADMVPNHMGIDSQWVIEHPDWFISLNQPPYPSYTFNSENLSDDPRVNIVLEDHYYDHSDASVVFQLTNYQTNNRLRETKYVYHGNDGTSFPWNDTAQLDYTNPEVREAVIQVILHVARNFPVIRFDAAMTLARKHVQRLWFPEPGAGGAIPSRSQYGLTKAEFDEKVPEEFWREVVDRVATEVPDTLLLAEAFWMMEGYFVRTLGMHRVYNSAFMHMLRDEDNAKYRLAIKNTLEFDPQILKRYVNFMNNPDEKTAVEQFGNGDKYFGVCTLLSTLPGLPMFGHGQVEGYSEKYGMEFRRAKWDETPDDGLIRGHEWRIFPLLHRRFLFADVEHFLLFDFYLPNGGVDEEVFAYSNRFNDPSTGSGRDERGLVIYHNKFANTRGWIKTSAAFIDKSSRKTLRKNIAEGLGLPRVGYVIFKDYVAQLEYIRSCEEIWDKGMYIELGAYQCHVFMDFRFVENGDWRLVCEAQNGAGVQSMQAKWMELFSTIEETKVEEKSPVKKRAVRKVATKAKKERGRKKEAVAAKMKAPVKKAVAEKKVQPKAKKPVVKADTVKPKPKKKPASKAKPIIKKTVKKDGVRKKVIVKKSLAKKAHVTMKPK